MRRVRAKDLKNMARAMVQTERFKNQPLKTLYKRLKRIHTRGFG